MIRVLKATPRKKAMKGSGEARRRYLEQRGKTGAKARAKRVAGVVEPTPKMTIPPLTPEPRLSHFQGPTKHGRIRGSNAYRNLPRRMWPIPQVRVTPPVNEIVSGPRRRTGVRPSQGNSLAPGLEGGVDPGLFRRPEHFPPPEPEEEEEEEEEEPPLDPEVQRIVDLMRGSKSNE